MVLSPSSAKKVVLSAKVLFDNVSVVANPTNVSVDVGNVSVPVLRMVDILGAVKVLLVRVSVVPRATIVSVASGRVNVLLRVCDVTNFVDVAVVPDTSKFK